MNQNKFEQITEALYSYSASVLKEQILQIATLEELFEISLSTIERAAFRAAWTLEHTLSDDLVLLAQKQSSIIDLYHKSNNWSVLRSVTKLVMEILCTNDIYNLSADEEEIIINKTFAIVENKECPIAVRCNAYDILYALVIKHAWITTELKTQIRFDLEKNSTPALASRGNRILKKLERITKS